MFTRQINAQTELERDRDTYRKRKRERERERPVQRYGQTEINSNID
jgi:hypothetical protein